MARFIHSFAIDLYPMAGWHGIIDSNCKMIHMKTLLIKTISVILFLLVFIKSWAADIQPDASELPWFKQPWAWLVAVGIFAVLVIGYIKTGEKKPKDSNDHSL